MNNLNVVRDGTRTYPLHAREKREGNSYMGCYGVVRVPLRTVRRTSFVFSVQFSKSPPHFSEKLVKNVLNSQRYISPSQRFDMADNLLLILVCDYGMTVKQATAWIALHADHTEQKPLKTIEVARRLGRDQSGLSKLLLRAARRCPTLQRHHWRGRPMAYFNPTAARQGGAND